MWEAIREILTGSNGTVIGVLAVLVVMLLIICVKQGLVRVQTDRLTIGRDNKRKER